MKSIQTNEAGRKLQRLVIASHLRRPGDDSYDWTKIQEFISQNSKDEKITQFLDAVRPINDTVVSTYLKDSENGKKLFTALTDQKVGQAITSHDEKFKKEKLPGLIEDEIKKRFPDETEEQKRIRQQDDRIKTLEDENKKEKLRSKALELITEFKLPFAPLVDSFLGEDEDATVKKLQAFKDVYDKSVQDAVTEAVGSSNGRKPKERTEDPKTLQAMLEQARKSGNMLEVIRIKNKMAELDKVKVVNSEPQK